MRRTDLDRIELGDRVVNVAQAQNVLDLWLRWTYFRLAKWGY